MGQRLQRKNLVRSYRQRLISGSLKEEGMVEVIIRSDVLGKPRHDQVISAVAMVLDRVAPGGYSVVGTDVIDGELEPIVEQEPEVRAKSDPAKVEAPVSAPRRTLVDQV